MKTSKSILVAAAKVMSPALMESLSTSPEFGIALANFDYDNVTECDSGMRINKPEIFDDGPTTMLAIALANPKNEAEVAAIVTEFDTVITEKLGPAVEAARRLYGLKD